MSKKSSRRLASGRHPESLHQARRFRRRRLAEAVSIALTRSGFGRLEDFFAASVLIRDPEASAELDRKRCRIDALVAEDKVLTAAHCINPSVLGYSSQQAVTNDTTVVLDTTSLTITEVRDKVLDLCRERFEPLRQ